MNRRLIAISMIILCGFGLRLVLDRQSAAGLSRPLNSIPDRIGAWRSLGDQPMSDAVRGVLHADDTVARTYEVIPGVQTQLFIAYYRTQRAGEMMHSPRNCLPGSGWEPMSLSLVRAEIAGHSVEYVNRYLVERDGTRLLMVYWYQEHERIITSEYQGKLMLMWDAIRLHRRDGALVRVSMVLGPEMDEDAATHTILQFVHSASPYITSALRN